MKHGWKWLVLAVVFCAAICLQAGLACAQGETGRTLPVTMADAGETYVNVPASVIINAEGAAALQVTDEWNYTDDLDQYWQWSDPSEWGLNHEHVEYTTMFPETGEKTLTFRAYWAEDVVDGEELPWIEQSITIQVLSLGEAGAPVISQAEPETGSVTRGGMLGISLETGANAETYGLTVHSGPDVEGNVVYSTGGEGDGIVYIPTWTMEAGEYTIRVKNQGPQYTASSSMLHFTVAETDWTEPTEAVWTASKQTVLPGEPVTVGVYVPGAEYIMISAEMDGEEDIPYDFEGSVGTYTTAFDFSGQPVFKVYDEDGPWGGTLLGTYTGVTVEEGEKVPAPVLTCGETMEEGGALAYSIAPGEGAEAYDGMTYRVTLKTNDPRRGRSYREETEPGEHSFSWAEISEVFDYRLGDTLILQVDAFCPGYEAARTEKAIFITGAGRDSGFTISLEGGTDGKDGARLIPVNTGVTLRGSGLPDDAENVEYLSFGEWRQIPRDELTRGFLTGNSDEPVLHEGVVARYLKKGVYYYSNVAYIDYYRNGVMPEPQVSFQAGGSSMTAARDEAVVIRIANMDEYAEYGPYALYYGFSAQSGWIDRGSLTTDENGLATLDIAELEAGNEYTIQIFASGRAGISSSNNSSLKLTVTEPTALSFRADKSTVYAGEAYRISGYVPGAIRTRIVENNGDSYESPYGNVVSMTFAQEEAGIRTYRLEAMYPAEGTEEAQWTAAGAADVTVTVNTYGDLNELAEVTMPEEIRPGSGITLTLESETIESMDRVAVRILDKRENLVFRAVKKQAMGLTIPGTVPEDLSEYYDEFYVWGGPGEPVFRANEIYTIRFEYTKKGYESGVAEQQYFAYSGQAGNWLTADGGLGPIIKNSGETVALTMNLPAGARTVRVLRTDGDWYGTGHNNETGSTEEYTYSLTCTGTGDGFIVAWYTMDENPGWSDEDWNGGYYSNAIPCSISCSHGTTETSYEWDSDSICIPDPEDETKHLRSGRARQYLECAICGEILEDLGEVTLENYPESHRYNGYMTCQVCGFACPHSDIVREITTGYEWVSDTQHKYIEQAPEIYEDCPVCGNYVHLEPMYTETIEDHTDADGNGVCDVCGSSIQGNWTWRLHDGILMIEGSGAIPGFSSAEGTGWYKARSAIKEVQIPEGITSIGAYAFAGLTESTRISFLQATRPAIDPQAFSGSRVICRYYTEPEEGAENTWTGTYGATNIEWVYLPLVNTTSNGNLWYYANDDNWGEGWVFNDLTPIKVTRKQAEELTFRGRTVTLYDLPAEQADRDVYEQHWEIMSGLDFRAKGEGNYALTMPETVNNMVLSLDAAGWTLTVDASATGENAFGMVMAGRGTLDLTAKKVSSLFLRGFYSDGEVTAPGNVTIRADVGTVHYYNSSNSQYRFAGTATVYGTIENGFEYGTATIRILNLPEFTESDSVVSQFKNVRQDAPIVLNSALNVSGASSFGTYTEQNCRLGYELTNNNGKDWWRLQITPLAGNDNAQPVHVSDVADLKADFSVEDIYWGEHTSVTLNRARPGQTVTVTVPEGVKCECLSVMHSNAVINGSFYQMDVDDWHQENGPFQVTLNGTVDHFNMYLNLKLCSMTLSAGAHIREGQLYRPLYETVYFENVGAGTMMQNGRLTILSHRQNQRIASLAPSEETLTAAAGLNAGEVAVMDITDASLTETEAEELSTLTTEEGGTADAVFDVSINAYNAETQARIDEITELNEPVTIQVKNLTGTTAYVARLHEGEDGLTAEKLESEITGDTIAFQSDLFSKYVLVRTGEKTFAEPEITVEYYLSDNSVLISFPWVDGADYHAIKICDKATGEKAYNWSEVMWTERSLAEKCMFQVNIMQGGQDRLMAAGEYTAEITLKGDGYTDGVFQVDFEVFSSLPNFAANHLPEGLTKIEEEAFAGIGMTVAEIPGRCTEIGKKAFDGSTLEAVLVPAGVRTIGDEAFPADTVIFTTKGSEAQRWAEEKGYTVKLVIR